MSENLVRDGNMACRSHGFFPCQGVMRGVDVVGVYNFACSLREVLAKHPFLPHGCGLFSGSYFPSFSEGLSLRECTAPIGGGTFLFPFLFGGTFIEGTVGEVPLPGEMKISLPFRRDFH